MAGVLDGWAALVTGASRGIGREIALRLAREGALVAVHYGSGRGGAEETVAAIRDSGGKAFAIGADLADVSELPAMFEALDRGLSAHGAGGLDILVNNAGIGSGGDISTTDEALYDRIMAVDLKAPFFITQHAVPRMRDGGAIINISSTVSLAAYPVCLAYATAKAGLNHFTRSLAAGLAQRRIRVNAVAPGATATEFGGGAGLIPEVAQHSIALTALGRMGQVEDMGGIVTLLASPDGSWITGQVIACNGGMHL